METACSVAVQDTFSILIDSNIEELCLFEQNHNRVSPYRMVHVCAANLNDKIVNRYSQIKAMYNLNAIFNVQLEHKT